MTNRYLLRTKVGGRTSTRGTKHKREVSQVLGEQQCLRSCLRTGRYRQSVSHRDGTPPCHDAKWLNGNQSLKYRFTWNCVFGFLIASVLHILDGNLTPSMTSAFAQIQIDSPPELFKAFQESGAFSDANYNTLVGSTAAFGTPVFHSAIQGRAVYVPSKTQHCDNTYCKQIDQTLSSDRLADASPAPLYVVDRGECSFKQKVRIAQECGARAVIIADAGISGWNRDEVKHILLSTDGSPDNVEIPSMLITYSDGEILKKYARKLSKNANAGAYLRLQWSMPAEYPVIVNFWTDPANVQANIFLRDFAPFAKKFASDIEFNPYYAVYPLQQDSLCVRPDQIFRGTDKEYSMAIKNTEGHHPYCALPPAAVNMIKLTEVSGSDIIREDILQLCLREVFKEKQHLYWDYQEAFWSKNPDIGCQFHYDKFKDGEELSSCTSKILSVLLNRKELDELNACTTSETALNLLRKSENSKGWSTFAVQINGMRMPGDMKPDTLAEAICSATRDPYLPGAKQYRAKHCKSLLEELARKKEVRIQEGKEYNYESVVTIVVMLLIVCGVLGYLYQKKVNAEMVHFVRDEVIMEVRSQINAYRKLEDDVTAPPEVQLMDKPSNV